MGKRELLLIVGFIAAGIIVYEITAPAPKAGEQGFSLSAAIAHVRRAVHGNRGRAEVTHTTSYPVNSDTMEVRLSGPFMEVTVQGEDRADAGCELRVFSTGFDDAEAKGLADRTVLKTDQAGSTLTFGVDYPQEGRQNSSIVLKVPSRLRVRVEQSGTRTTVSNIAGVELVSSRGETSLTQVRGRALVTHRGGRLTIEDAASLKLTSRAGDTRVTRVAGDATFDLQGGELVAADVGGSMEIEARAADITLHAGKSKGPIRVNANGGSITIDDVKADLRVDGRGAEISAAIAAGAPSVAIYSEGGEDVRLTAPPGGYQLDAVATDAHITVPDHTVDVTTTDGEQRANGRVGTGGPTITLRARHGDIVIRR